MLSFNKILPDAARKSGNSVETISGEKKFNFGETRKFKPWFNHECKDRRKSYPRAKHYHLRCKTAASRDNLVQESKQYKKCLNIQYRLFQSKFICKLRKFECTDPKAYWAILNKSCNVKQAISNISVETFLNFSKI